MIKEIVPNSANSPEFFEALGEAFYLPTEDKVIAAILKWQAEGSISIAYIEDEAIVGAAIILVRQNVILKSIGVRKEKRGNGIGKSIIEYIKINYAKTINLETDEESVEFYRNSGFRCYEIHKLYDNRIVKRYICNY